MNGRKRRTRTFYQYAAVYFIVLFLLSGVIMFSVLRYSASKLVTLETKNISNSMRQAADSLEKQYQTLENIAIQIGTIVNYRPNMIHRGPIYDIELLEGFKQYVNYSPLANQYFLAYGSENKIYTSTGNTSYFDYYAPANFGVPYDLTTEMLQRIVNATAPSFEYSGSYILIVLPVHFYGYDTTSTGNTVLCFALSKTQVQDYLAQVSVGLPEQFAISIGGRAFFSSGEAGMEELEANKRFLALASAKGKVVFGAVPQMKGWQLLFTQNSSLLYIGAAACLLLASLIALMMAHFSLLPLEKLIEKYMPTSARIENDFRQLDAILREMDEMHSSSRYQLRNHLLLLVLKGDYSQRLIERWSMLGIALDKPVCCVYLIENGALPENKDALKNELEGMSDAQIYIYTAETDSHDNLIVIANYEHAVSHEEALGKVQDLAKKRGLAVYAGKSVDSPKRLPLSLMSALTAIRYNADANVRQGIPADALAERVVIAAKAGEGDALEQACDAISEFLLKAPLDGMLTKQYFYELISSIVSKAEGLGMKIEKSEINNLVLLSDEGMIVSDLKKMLLEAASAAGQPKAGGDDTAKLIVEYVIANAYDPDINLQDMSERFGLSADYISSMIKRETGSAFKEYLTMLRVSEARRLLLENKTLTVNDVALRVGYRKASNFSKKFKELTGMLPSQMR